MDPSSDELDFKAKNLEETCFQDILYFRKISPFANQHGLVRLIF